MNEITSHTTSMAQRVRATAVVLTIAAMAFFGLASDAQAAPGSFRPRAASPFGHLDQAEWTYANDEFGFKLRAWAIDPNTTSAVWLQITADGQLVDSVLANQYRPDVGAAYPGYGDYHGIDFTMPASWIPGFGGYYFPEICVTALNVGAGFNTPLGCHPSFWLA